MGLIKNLVALFLVEGQVRGLRSRLDSAERYLANQNRLLAELEQHGAELETRKRQVQARIAILDLETASLDERLEKLRTELNSASTNKQYTALLTELNKAKLDRTELENRTLEQMEALEQTGADLKKVQGESAERRKVKERAAAELKARHDEVGERLAELEAERRIAAQAIPAKELKIFNEVADAHDGEAMAPIEEIDRRRREYACGSCNLHLPFETLASLLGTADVVVRCTACGRILYLQDETRGALAKK